MKKTIFVLSLIIGISSITIAQTADDIINKNIAAMGGLDKLNSIKTLYEEDSINAGAAKFDVKVWMVNKKYQRVEFKVMGMTGFSILRTDSGWRYLPFQGQKTPEPITSDEVKKSQDELYTTDHFVNYKEKGYKVSYQGKDESEGSETYKLEVIISDSISATYYIDPDTYYVTQVKMKVNVNGKTTDETLTFSDYQKTPEGYIVPMEKNVGMGDMKTYVVKINPTFDNAIFSPTVKIAGK